MKPICPQCKSMALNEWDQQCYKCGWYYSMPYQPTQQQYYNQATYYQHHKQTNTQNSQLMQCPVCGNMIYRYADVCPYCGKQIEKKLKRTPFLDFICILCLFFSAICYTYPPMVPVGFTIALFWFAVYLALYNKYKKKPEYDESKLKQSMIAIAVLFLINIGFGVVIIT